MDEVVSSSRRRVVDLFLPRNRLDKQMTGSLLPSFFPSFLSLFLVGFGRENLDLERGGGAGRRCGLSPANKWRQLCGRMNV